MLENRRSNPVVLSLPRDYTGKMLTIAQATPTEGDHADDTVYPCSTTLYYNYAYERNLIAESAYHLIPATLLFALAVTILIIFVWSSFFGQPDIGLPLLSLLAFLMMSSLMLHALVFIDLWYQSNHPWLAHLSAIISLIALILLLLPALIERQRGSPFFHKFFLTLFIGFIVSTGVFLILDICFTEIRLLLHFPLLFCLNLFTLLFFLSSLATTAVQTASAVIGAHAEHSILLAREQFARSSYNRLYLQTEHTMELRHDIRKHLTIRRTLLTHQEYEQAGSYVDDLVAENQAIRPIVRCGNQMLDIVLNSKLDEAMQPNVCIQVLYAEAPATLPLSDTELPSLMMNVMDNAVHAALCANAEERFIELELRINGQFLLFRCANNAEKNAFYQNVAAESVQSPHGYGLKIINRILARYGSVSRIESDTEKFQISFALPLQ